jgi:hypothetical protein
MTNVLLTPRSLLLLLVAMGGALGGCAVSVDAEVPEVEITQRNLTFSGSLSGLVPGDVAMSRSFSQSHSKLLFPAGFTPEVRVLGVMLVAGAGIDDFSFVRLVRVSMSDDSGVRPATEIVNYREAADAQRGPILDIANTAPADVLDQLKTDSATFVVEVAGALPEQDWTMDVSVRLAASLRYQ